MPRKSTTKTKKVKHHIFYRIIKGIIIGIAFLLFLLGVVAMFAGVMLNTWRDDVHNYLLRSYSGNLNVNEVKGNLISGFILNDVYFLPQEHDGIPMPVWTGQSINLKFDVWGFLRGNIQPTRVILESFTFRFEQNPDGSFKIPQIFPQPLNAQGGTQQLGETRIIVRNSLVIYEENPAYVENPLEYKIENINANSLLNKDGEIQIFNFNGEFLLEERHRRSKRTHIRSNGIIDTKGTLKSDLNIEFRSLHLWETCRMLGRLLPTDSRTRPVGVGDLNLKLTGDLLNPQLDGKGNLQTVKIGNFQLNDVYLNMRYSNKNLIIENSVAKAYNGRIALTGEIMASSSPAKFIIDAEVMNLDLGLYVEENHRHQLNPVSGMFTGKFAGGGYFDNLSTFAGNGYLECGGGMYLNPFRDAGKDQPRKYRVEKLGFDKLDIDFKIRNNAVNIDKFIMDSRYIGIESIAGITFDGDVNAEGIIKAQAELLRSSPYFTDIVRFLPSKDIQIPVKFRLFGPVDNLMIHSALPPEMIDNLLGDDYARRQAAQNLLETYFGGDASSITHFMPNITQDE